VVFPPQDLTALLDLGRFLQQHAEPGLLLGPDGEQVPLPEEVYRVLAGVVDTMRQGKAITLVPHTQRLTTQEAADILGVSRPTLVKLLEEGKIAYEQPGRHRRILFTDLLAYQDWDEIADQQAFDLWLGPSVASYEWFRAELAPIAGAEFTRRLGQHLPPSRGQLRIRHPAIGHDLRWNREILDLAPRDEQQVVIYLPADEPTSQALGLLREQSQPRTLRAL
jgi:excisionase family DNA binding protein